MGVATGFSNGRHAPPPPPVRLHMGSVGTGRSCSVPSPKGVCCSILMTKKGAGARSRYHTLICLKRASLTIQSAGVRRNPVKAGGCVNDKRQKQPLLFCPWNKSRPISECCWSSPKPRMPSCISMGVFLHKEGSTAAVISLVLLSLSYSLKQ